LLRPKFGLRIFLDQISIARSSSDLSRVLDWIWVLALRLAGSSAELDLAQSLPHSSLWKWTTRVKVSGNGITIRVVSFFTLWSLRVKYIPYWEVVPGRKSLMLAMWTAELLDISTTRSKKTQASIVALYNIKINPTCYTQYCFAHNSSVSGYLQDHTWQKKWKASTESSTCTAYEIHAFARIQ